MLSVVMDEVTKEIKGETSMSMMFVDYIVFEEEFLEEFNNTLNEWR